MIGGAALIATLATGYSVNQWSSAEAAEATKAPISIQSSAITVAQRSLADLTPDQETLAGLYDMASPSVVNIQVVASPQAQLPNQNPFEGLPFPFDPNGPQQQQPAYGVGSGFVYDAEGHIVTNNHVIADADPENIIVNFSNGHWTKAELVAADSQSDLAVLKVTPPAGTTLTPLVLAPANSLRVGYYVVAIGSPFGLEQTMTMGVVSALDRTTPVGSLSVNQPTYSLPDVIQTDTAINPGNSGGPLLNLKGEVVGVNFMIESSAGTNSGVGFAIPVSVVEKVVSALIEEGAYEYAYLGISGQTINAVLAEEHQIPDNTLGVFVGSVPEGGPASEAGVEVNDIITAVDGQSLRHFEDLLSYLFHNATPGQTVTLHLLRDGQGTELDVELAARPRAVTTPADPQESDGEIGIGDALKTAKEAVIEGGLITNVDSTKATKETRDGRSVWVVTLSGDDKNATVTVDAQSGEVVALDVE